MELLTDIQKAELRDYLEERVEQTEAYYEQHIKVNLDFDDKILFGDIFATNDTGRIRIETHELAFQYDDHIVPVFFDQRTFNAIYL